MVRGSLQKDRISLRPVTMGDVGVLLAWRNDPVTRALSLNTNIVGREEHIAWLAGSLSSKTRQLFIAEEAGVPVGTVRADLVDGCHMLSWTVAPNARGHGIGKVMVRLLTQKISGPIRAKVKACNVASMRIAEHAGMSLEKEVGGVLYYASPSMP